MTEEQTSQAEATTEEVSVPGLAGLASLMGMLRPYPTKGQRPFIDRRNTGSGHVTGRVHICMGCGSPFGTLERLFSDNTPVDQQTKSQRRSHGKPRIGRAFTLYTHKACRAESMTKANEFIQRQLEEALHVRSEAEGRVA